MPKAEPLFRRSLAIFERSLGNTHPNARVVLKNYARLMRKLSV